VTHGQLRSEIQGEDGKLDVGFEKRVLVCGEQRCLGRTKCGSKVVIIAGLREGDLVCVLF